MPWLQGSPEGLQVDVRTTGNHRHPLPWAKPCLIPRRIQLPRALRGLQLSWTQPFRAGEYAQHTHKTATLSVVRGSALEGQEGQSVTCQSGNARQENPVWGGMGVGVLLEGRKQHRLVYTFPLLLLPFQRRCPPQNR